MDDTDVNRERYIIISISYPWNLCNQRFSYLLVVAPLPHGIQANSNTKLVYVPVNGRLNLDATDRA